MIRKVNFKCWTGIWFIWTLFEICYNKSEHHVVLDLLGLFHRILLSMTSFEDIMKNHVKILDSWNSGFHVLDTDVPYVNFFKE